MDWFYIFGFFCTALPKTWLRGVINIIDGGFIGGGSSNLACKCYVHNLNFVNSITAKKRVTRSLPAITFTNEDFEGIE